MQDLHLIDDTDLTIFLIPRIQSFPAIDLILNHLPLEPRRVTQAAESIAPYTLQYPPSRNPIHGRMNRGVSSAVISDPHERVEVDALLDRQWIVCVDETTLRTFEVELC